MSKQVVRGAGVLLFTVSLLTLFPAFAWGDSGADHQVAQAWPIQLGASGGNVNDYSKLYCCSGTLGAVVQDAQGMLYILSNNHVLARTNVALPGEDVSQPGAIDQRCGQTGVLADLTTFIPLAFRKSKLIPLNTVDAAIALARPGAVRTDGAILDIGPVSARTVAAFVGQAVRKSGRTTGFTTGAVAAIDVTVDVGYSKTCGGASNQVARFVNQIRITPGAFSAGGDSGSLIVESGTVDPTDQRPRAVGLLFAGSSTTTIANPIGNVLSALGVTMVGGGAATTSSAAKATATVEKARNAKARHSDELLGVPGAKGHGVGLSESGQPVIEVYLDSDSAAARGKAPASVEGVPVRVVVTGPIVAF